MVLFANSGSEANDLAWRMARTVTGRRGMIVTDHAYHGSTYLTMATSPEELGIETLGELGEHHCRRRTAQPQTPRDWTERSARWSYAGEQVRSLCL